MFEREQILSFWVIHSEHLVLNQVAFYNRFDLFIASEIVNIALEGNCLRLK